MTSTSKEKAARLIQAAQEKTEREGLLWCIAEDLKAVVQEATESECAIIAEDLEAGSHTLQSCEAQVREYAKNNRSSGVGICPPAKVPGILRGHFGLPESPAQTECPAPKPERLNIMDFWE